jgi:anti-anti-sigma regulatory factor
MKECPYCNSEVPDIAHYCASCGKSFGTEEAAEATAKAEPAAGAQIETRYVPGHAGIAIIKIVGNCDNTQVNKLNMELANTRNDNPEIVIFDLSGTEAVCSMALSAILAFVSDREDERENSTALVNVRDSVMQVIDCLGIGSMLPVFATIKDAIEALRAE